MIIFDEHTKASEIYQPHVEFSIKTEQQGRVEGVRYCASTGADVSADASVDNNFLDL